MVEDNDDVIQNAMLTLSEKIAHLEKYKAYTHERLDKMGVPETFPNGKHSAAGCRIGDRLDWVENRLANYRERVDSAVESLKGLVTEIARREAAEDLLRALGVTAINCQSPPEVKKAFDRWIATLPQ